MTKELVDIEMAAHGGTVVEIRKAGRQMAGRQGLQDATAASPPNTEMELTGPAAGHERLKTNADPTGRKVLGMINNCAGGVTPWGTYVMAEENIHGYFSGELPADHHGGRQLQALRHPGKAAYDWGSVSTTASTSRKEPNEANRFGWIVEIDSVRSDLDAEEAHRSRPLQARGRRVDRQPATAAWSSISATTSASTTSTNSSPRGTFDRDNRAANIDLLDDGTLYVAKFNDDGRATGCRWCTAKAR